MGTDHHRLCGADVADVALSAAADRDSLMHAYLITALVMAATWDAWRWYVQRVWESPEEAASLALTVAFLGVLGVSRRSVEGVRLPLIPVALLLTAFAASYGALPPIARAAI